MLFQHFLLFVNNTKAERYPKKLCLSLELIASGMPYASEKNVVFPIFSAHYALPTDGISEKTSSLDVMNFTH